MATIDIGKLKPVFKGTYDNSTAYVLDDIVYYNGSSYVAKTSTTGNLPTDATKWNILASGSGGIYDSTLSIGSANQVLAVNSGASALEFQDASSGKIGQVVHTAYDGVRSTHNINNTDHSTNFLVQITPSATNSTILVQGHIQMTMGSSYGGYGIWFTREVSGQSDVTVGTGTGGGSNTQERYHSQAMNTYSAYSGSGSGSASPFMFTDTPNTTSQVTYRLRVRGVSGCGDITVGGTNSGTQRFITPFTAMEILA